MATATGQAGGAQEPGGDHDWTVELDPTPGRRQGQEEILLHRGGATERIVLHDYARVYDVPGLYEEVVQRRLECASPATVAAALVEAAGAEGARAAALRAFDLGAGPGTTTSGTSRRCWARRRGASTRPGRSCAAASGTG